MLVLLRTVGWHSVYSPRSGGSCPVGMCMSGAEASTSVGQHIRQNGQIQFLRSTTSKPRDALSAGPEPHGVNPVCRHDALRSGDQSNRDPSPPSRRAGPDGGGPWGAARAGHRAHGPAACRVFGLAGMARRRKPVTLWHLTTAIGPYPQGTTLRTETLRGCGSTILEPAPLEVHVCS